MDEWHSYRVAPPAYGVLVEFRQMTENLYPQPNWIGYRDNLHPEMNVALLHWRLTGIGRYQLEKFNVPLGR